MFRGFFSPNMMTVWYLFGKKITVCQIITITRDQKSKERRDQENKNFADFPCLWFGSSILSWNYCYWPLSSCQQYLHLSNDTRKAVVRLLIPSKLRKIPENPSPKRGKRSIQHPCIWEGLNLCFQAIVLVVYVVHRFAN